MSSFAAQASFLGEDKYLSLTGERFRATDTPSEGTKNSLDFIFILMDVRLAIGTEGHRLGSNSIMIGNVQRSQFPAATLIRFTRLGNPTFTLGLL